MVLNNEFEHEHRPTMKYSRLIVAGVLALLVLPAQLSQGQRIERLPGYFDFDALERAVDAETTLEVNIKGALLRMAAEAARVEDDLLAEMLLKLQGIQVRGYTLSDAEVEDLQDQIGRFARELSDEGWERVVRVREEDEYVEMMVRDTSGERVEGMVVFVLGEGTNETVFVNIVGQIDPEDIGRIGRRFRIRVLEDL